MVSSCKHVRVTAVIGRLVSGMRLPLSTLSLARLSLLRPVPTY